MAITESTLKPADILVSTSSATVSGFIRYSSESFVSHAALYIGNGVIIESDGNGVNRKTLSDAISDDTLSVVYRRKELTESQAKAAIEFAYNQLGKSYDAGGVFISGMNNSPKGGQYLAGFYRISILLGLAVQNYVSSPNSGPTANPDKAFYCSELVTRSFEVAGMPILDIPANESMPSSITFSSTLDYVGHLKGE